MKRSIRLIAAILIIGIIMSLGVPAIASASQTPARVTGFTFRKAGAHNVVLTWNTQNNVDGYIIYLENSDHKSYKRLTKGAYNGTYNITGLSPNSDYRFAIRAYSNIDGKEVISPSFPYVDTHTAPVPVSSLKANVLDGKIDISYKATKNADGYYIFYDNGSGWKNLGGTMSTSYHTDVPDDSDSYSFGVKVFYKFNDYRYLSADIPKVSVDTLATPAKVSGFKFVRSGSTSVQLSWTKQNHVTGYILYQGIDGSDSYKRIAKGAYNGAFTVKNLKPNTNYRYAIRAYTMINGEEVLSPSFPTVTARTMAEPVSNLKAAVSGSNFKLSWTASKGASGYCVFYNTGSGWKTYGETVSAAFTKAKPENAALFTFGVKTYTIIGGKRYISTDLTKVQCSTQNAPANVKGFGVKGIGAVTAELKWTQQADAIGYVLYRKEYGDSSYTRVARGEYKGTFVMKDLSPNTTYLFAIRAYTKVNGKEVLSNGFPEISAITMVPLVKTFKVTLSEERSLFKWSAVSGAAGYYVYCNSGTGWTSMGNTTDTQMRRTKGLSPATVYTFGICTYQYVNGKKVISRDMTKIKSCTYPSTPNYAIAKSGDKYTVKWKAMPGADTYKLYTQVPGGNWVCKATTTALSCTFTQANTPNLYFALRAVKTVGKTQYISDFWKKLYTEKTPSGTLCTFGDSIGKGTGSHRYSYAEIYAEKHNLAVTRHLVSGGSLCSALDFNHICQDVLDNIKAGSNYNYIMLEGGLNDYYYSAQPGSVTPAGTTKFNMNTVCGALEAAFTHIRKYCPNSKVIYVMIHDAAHQSVKPNDLGLTLTDYADIIRTVCNKYGVQVANCLDTGLRTDIASISRKYTYHYFGVYPDGDGVHPSEEAYTLFYLPAIEAAIKKAKPIKNSAG